MNTNNNSNNNRNDDDSKDMSIDIQIQTNTNNPNRIITISSNKINNNKENSPKTCKCGDPSSHKHDCGLYCGMDPCEEELIKLPKCDHYLHKSCLESLLYTRLSKCPLCRSSIESWRRSKHFRKIEKEIADEFQSDTEQAILLSQKTFEEEQREEQRRNSRANRQESGEERNRERERSRSRERGRNNHRNDRNNDNNRRVRFRSWNSNRSRNRNDRNDRHSV